MKFAREVKPGRDLFPLAVTLVVSLLTNMALGFLAGTATHYIFVQRPGRKIDQ